MNNLYTSPIADEAPVMTTTLSSMFSLKKLWKNHSIAWRKVRVGHAKASITMLAGGTTKFKKELKRSMITRGKTHRKMKRDEKEFL